MSGRATIRDMLKLYLPTWQVIADTRQIDTVTKPGAVALLSQKITRPEKFSFDYVQEDLVLWVLTATSKVELIEDDLDAMLLEVIAALESIEGVLWTEADRSVLNDTIEGWKLTLTCGYPAAALIDPNPEN